MVTTRSKRTLKASSGGILGSLSNLEEDHRHQSPSVEKVIHRIPRQHGDHPKTLFISKSCEGINISDSDYDDDISKLDSPQSILSSSSQDECDSCHSDEQTDENEQDETESDSDSISANSEDIEAEDEDLVVDDDASEVPERETEQEIDDQELSEESDYDPDTETEVEDDDDNLEVDTESIDDSSIHYGTPKINVVPTSDASENDGSTVAIEACVLDEDNEFDEDCEVEEVRAVSPISCGQRSKTAKTGDSQMIPSRIDGDKHGNNETLSSKNNATNSSTTDSSSTQSDCSYSLAERLHDQLQIEYSKNTTTGTLRQPEGPLARSGKTTRESENGPSIDKSILQSNLKVEKVIMSNPPCSRSPCHEKIPSKCTEETEKVTFVFSGRKVRRGQWKLGAKLGSGAFGVVHIGMNTRTGALMAVKSIRMENAATRDTQREIDVLKSLDHKNIVRYHGAEVDAKYLHIFQEWVPGGSVTSLLSKFGPFPLSVVKNYFSQILDGLVYLHSQNVMHRDLKGSNVLINDEGIVKLADFGASRRFEKLQSDMLMSLTLRGIFEEKYSAKADIWSVGCIAFQMATSSAPWKRLGLTNPVSLFNHIRNTSGLPDGDYPTSSSRDQIMLEGLKRILGYCFDRDATARPDAISLRGDPFFSDNGLWSPIEDSNENVTHASSVKSPFFGSPSPRQGFQARRNSLGSFRSPLLSPPLPKFTAGRSPSHLSPMRDPREWPTWAREKHASLTAGKEISDSLAYSDATSEGNHKFNDSNGLFGLAFVDPECKHS